MNKDVHLVYTEDTPKQHRSNSVLTMDNLILDISTQIVSVENHLCTRNQLEKEKKVMMIHASITVDTSNSKMLKHKKVFGHVAQVKKEKYKDV